MNVSKDEKEPEKVLEVASDAILNFMEQPWENTKELAGNIRDSVVDAVWRSTPQEISEDAGEILGDILTAVATGGGGKAAASGAKIAGNKLLALGKTGVKEFVEGLGDLGKIGAKNAVYVGATTGIENAAKNSFINRLMMMASEAGDEAKKLTGVVEGATSKADDIATIAGKTGSVTNTVTSTTGELIENAVIGTPIVEGTKNITKEIVEETTEKTTLQMLEEATDNIATGSKVNSVANAADQTTATTVVEGISGVNGSGVNIRGKVSEPDIDNVKVIREKNNTVGKEQTTEMINNKPEIDGTQTNNNVEKLQNSIKSNQYSGDLIKVDSPDAAADALAERIGGKSRVKFSNDPSAREFDVISDKYIAQAKPDLKGYGKSWRKQTKATFEAAKQTDKIPYFQFEGEPSPDIIKKIQEYSERYGIDYVIDTKPLGVKN